MKKFLLFSFVNLFLFNISGFSQGSKKINIGPGQGNLGQNSTSSPVRTCGTMEALAIEMEKDPALKERMESMEIATQKQIHNIESGALNKVKTVYKIPVVVHVVYSNATENVSEAQIFSQIAALNRDYRKQNSDVSNVPAAFSGLAADAEIEFCLASLDPNGQPTNGITRTFTNNSAGFGNPTPSVKSDATDGKSPWNTANYMNMWVCNLQGNLLGYAQFPSGGSANTDGIVIDYMYFGTIGTATAPFNLGRTATHEVGHYLNLRHIWGDANCGDDNVSDTPTQQQSNNQCPAFPHVTCSNGPNGDMFMNYMDYVDDACMHMFTSGQKSRMVATLTSTRSSLLNNTNVQCNVPSQVLTCDTVGNYLSTSNLTVYRTTDIAQPGSGYISGTNSFGDIGYAEKFTPLLPLQKIYGARVGFGRAYGFSSATVNIKLWKADGPSGTPGTLLATKTVGLQDIVDDINAQVYTDVSFNSPISIASGSYFLGIDFNPSTLDTIALYTTVVGAVSTGKAYEQYDNGTWYPFTDAINSWGVNVALAVAPAVCVDYTGIEDQKKSDDLVQLYPNPNAGLLYLESDLFMDGGAILEIYDSTGKLLQSNKHDNLTSKIVNIDLSGFSTGLYLIGIKTKEEKIIKRFNLIR